MFRRQFICGAAGIGMAALTPAAMAAQGTASSEAYKWMNVPLGGGGYVNGLIFHPRERGLVYARTHNGGLYRRDAATPNWLPLLDGLGAADADLTSVLSLALDPDDPERLYAACGASAGEWARKAALLISTDRGQSWTIRDLDMRFGGTDTERGTGERLQVDPHRPEVLLLGSTENGLFLSTDKGQKFSRLSFKPRHVSLVMFDPSSASPESGCRRFWVGSHDQPGLYVTEDGGSSFSPVPGLPQLVPQRAVMARDRTLYVTFAQVNAGQGRGKKGRVESGAVWLRDRNGQWKDITPTKSGAEPVGFGFAGIDVDPRVPGRVVVATVDRWAPGEEMFLSLDAGQSWTPLGEQSRHDGSAYPWLADQLRRSGRVGWWISDLKIDPFDSAHQLYGTGYGLWETRNLGQGSASSPVTWQFSVAGMELASASEIRSPSGGVSLLAATSFVTGGAAWDQLEATPNAGLFTPRGEGAVSVDYAETAPAIIARTCQISEDNTGGRISLDGGATWRGFSAEPEQPGAEAPRGGRIAVSAKGGFMVWAPEGQAVLWSRDRGRTWKPCAGLPERRNVPFTPVADRTMEGVFYSYDQTRGRIYQSIDGGQSFEPVIQRLPSLQPWQSGQLVCAPGTVRDLWLATPDGLLHLPGVQHAARDIRQVTQARLVTLGKAAPGASYHSIYVWGLVQVGNAELDGLFRSTDRGESFVRVDDDRHRFGNLQAISADPLAYGCIFLAPRGRGIVMGQPQAGA